MRIFVTGGTGYIGSAIVAALVAKGHRVTGLARSEASASRLVAAGAEPVRGNLDDLGLLANAAATHDGVVHVGFNHDDWNAIDTAFRQDELAVNAMIGAMEGSDRPFVYTSGSGVLKDTGRSARDEEAELSDAPMLASRIAVEQSVVDAASHRVRSIVVRPGLVYGADGGGTMALLIGLAMREGGPFVIGEGWNVWSSLHRDDLAALYVAALEAAPAGSLFNAANEDRVSMREIAAAAARATGLHRDIRSIPLEEARKFAGGMADGLVSEKRIKASSARNLLNWHPTAPSIVEEIERGSYSKTLAAAAAARAEADVSGGDHTMINAFEVPPTATDQFLREWLIDLDFMRRQAGFLHGTLYESNSPVSRFRFVNVAHWRSAQDFERAQQGIMQRFETAGLDRVKGWTEIGVAMNASTFHTNRLF